jgi:hypothetical protein
MDCDCLKYEMFQSFIEGNYVDISEYKKKQVKKTTNKQEPF